MVNPVALSVGRFVVRVGSQPSSAFEQYITHPNVVEDFAADDPAPDPGYFALAVGEGDWPDLVRMASWCSCRPSWNWRRGPSMARSCGARSPSHPGPTASSTATSTST